MGDRIVARIGSELWDVEHFRFPGGELQVGLPGIELWGGHNVVVDARLSSAEGVVKLLLANEILVRVGLGRRTLVLPYCPYAQQDRVMEATEAFSLKVFAGLVNGMRFDRVVVCDPHSDVTPALLDNVRVVSQRDIVVAHPEMRRALGRDDAIIVAPDAGAAKKAAKAAAYYGREMICGTKVRDTATGALSCIELPEASRAAGKRAVIIDDICVGGATFLGLAAKLREAGARHVLLYCTHGVFSKGLEPFVGLIDWILTTDTFAGCPEQGNSDIPLYRYSIDPLARAHI